jgi:ABC-type Fe3+/spermidine/putrescine transport system ATPase subunit
MDQDFDLDVAEGEAIILRGPSGCGKTTLLRCLAELNVYQKGEVELHGK